MVDDARGAVKHLVASEGVLHAPDTHRAKERWGAATGQTLVILNGVKNPSLSRERIG